MKVLILSMPRCYTKSLQLCISNSLAKTQLSAIKRNGQRVGHLGEILHFNECYALGIDPITQKVMSPAPGLKLQHHVPVWGEDGFHYEPCQPHQPINMDMWRESLRIIKNSKKDCVAKFFPFKLTTPQFGLTDAEAEVALDQLINTFDVVIPVLRMDADARQTSHATALQYGWDVKNQQTDVKLIEPAKRQAALWQERENQFRRQCVKRGLHIVWSEQFLNAGHFEVLKSFGIKCNIPFPDIIEYSKLK